MFTFAEATKDMTAAETLNYYRNLYYAEPQVTERGIVANAINDYFREAAPRAEVAREIFEEMEANFDRRIAFYQDMRFRAYSVGKGEEVKYANTMITNLTIYREEIAELKKKYTGESQ